MCPSCRADNSRVTETRCLDGKTTVRRHLCSCGARWKTAQRIVPNSLSIETLELPISSPYVGRPQPTGSPPLGEVYPESDLICSDQTGSDRISYKQSERDSNEIGANLFARALSLFSLLWGEKYRARYFPTAADRNQFGRLLQGLPHDALGEVRLAFVNYLQDASPWVAQNHRHSLVCFCTSGGFNKYRVAAPAVSEKEARSMTAMQQWVARKR